MVRFGLEKWTPRPALSLFASRDFTFYDTLEKSNSAQIRIITIRGKIKAEGIFNATKIFYKAKNGEYRMKNTTLFLVLLVIFSTIFIAGCMQQKSVVTPTPTATVTTVPTTVVTAVPTTAVQTNQTTATTAVPTTVVQTNQTTTVTTNQTTAITVISMTAAQTNQTVTNQTK
jgi:hypothetical protein